MQLTRFTDYSIRVLIHVASRRDDELSSIQEIADAYDISRNHLMKVVVDLGRAGFLETIRGRAGGLRLGRPADTINLGELVRQTEQSLKLVDCSSCLIAPSCVLPRILAEATRAFLAVLDRYTLADLLRDRSGDLRALFDAALPAVPCSASA